jgi:hypothetical protein
VLRTKDDEANFTGLELTEDEVAHGQFTEPQQIRSPMRDCLHLDGHTITATPQKYSPRKGEASAPNSEGGAATRTIVTDDNPFPSFTHPRRLWWFEGSATREVQELVSAKNGHDPGFIPPVWSMPAGYGGRDPPSSAKLLRPTAWGRRSRGSA